MVFIKKVANADVGDADHVGGNDWDKLDDYHDDVDITGPAKINTETRIRSGKKKLMNPANTFGYTEVASAIAANRNVTEPLLTGNDTRVYEAHTQTLSNKTLDGTCTIPAPAIPSKEVSFVLYNDSGTYKAKNGTTGVVDYSNATDVAEVLKSIFNSVSTTTPLKVVVGPGNFTLKSWDGQAFKHSNFTIQGAGSETTNFIVHNDVWDVAGQNRVFGFQADGAQYTSIALASSATVDSFAVLTNSTTDLVEGCYVVIGDDAVMSPGAAKKGEVNRVAKIVATGGSPSQRIILEKFTKDSYSTASNAFIRRVDFLENCHFEGFQISSLQDLTTSIAFMRLDFAANVHMKDVKFKDWADFIDGGFHTNLVLNSVVNSNFDDIELEQSPERGHFTSGNLGYGISCRAGCETVYFNNVRAKGGIRHCFTTTANSETSKNGHPRNIWLVNCNSETTGESSWESHGEGDTISYINCSTFSSRSSGGTDGAAGTNDTDSFSNRCNNVRFINCVVENNRGDAFSVGGSTHGVVIQNCYVKNLYLNRTAVIINNDAYDVQVNGLFVDGVDHEAISIGTGVKNVNISNVVARNCCRTDNSLSLIKIGGGGTKNITISDCVLDSSNDSAIKPINVNAGAEDITFDGVHLVGAGTNPVFSGLNVKWNHLTCVGRKLDKPRFKTGRFEGNASAGTGLWEGQVTDVGGSKRIETTDGVFREYAQATLNAIEGFRVNTYTERDQNPYIQFRYRLENTTGLRFFAGWTSDDTQLGPTGTDPLDNDSGIALWLDTSVDGNLKIYHNSGDATGTVGAVIAAADTNPHVFEIRADNTNSKFQYRYDYGTWTDISTDIPAATTDLGVQFYIENNDTGVTKTLNMLAAHTDVPNI